MKSKAIGNRELFQERSATNYAPRDSKMAVMIFVGKTI